MSSKLVATPIFAGGTGRDLRWTLRVACQPSGRTCCRWVATRIRKAAAPDLLLYEYDLVDVSALKPAPSTGEPALAGSSSWVRTVCEPFVAV
jgi:hypothetical protein